MCYIREMSAPDPIGDLMIFYGANKLKEKEQDMFAIKKVIFNDPATIILWLDGTKTVVKVIDEKFDPEKGLAMAIAKKALGNVGHYYETFKKWLPDKEDEIAWDQPVPEEMWTKVAEYCDNDVIATEAAFHYLKADWTAGGGE